MEIEKQIDDANSKFTKGEKAKLILIFVTLSLIILVIISFNIYWICLIRKFNWLTIILTPLMLFFATIIGIVGRKYFLDLKNGVADIYNGQVKEKYSSSALDNDYCHFIVVGYVSHQVDLTIYNKIKAGDFITIRKTPISNKTLNVKINST